MNAGAAAVSRPAGAVPPAMREVRCANPSCRALLAKAQLAPGSTVEIVCRKCKQTVRVLVL